MTMKILDKISLLIYSLTCLGLLILNLLAWLDMLKTTYWLDVLETTYCYDFHSSFLLFPLNNTQFYHEATSFSFCSFCSYFYNYCATCTLHMFPVFLFVLILPHGQHTSPMLFPCVPFLFVYNQIV